MSGYVAPSLAWKLRPSLLKLIISIVTKRDECMIHYVGGLGRTGMSSRSCAYIFFKGEKRRMH